MTNQDDLYYRALYKNSDTLHALEHYTKIGLNRKNYLGKDLNNMIRDTK